MNDFNLNWRIKVGRFEEDFEKGLLVDNFECGILDWLRFNELVFALM